MVTEKIELGDLAEDAITKYRGIVVGFTKHITGCDRFTLQSQEIKDGKIPDAYNFDVTTVRLITKGVVEPVGKPEPLPEPVRKAGGPPTVNVFDGDGMTLQLHRCKLCGTRWLLWPDALHGGGWNLLDQYQRPGACCDNVAMGDQIEYLRDFDLNAALLVSHAETIRQLHVDARHIVEGYEQGLDELRARLALAEQENKDLKRDVAFKDSLIWTSRESALYKATYAAEQRAKLAEQVSSSHFLFGMS